MKKIIVLLSILTLMFSGCSTWFQEPQSDSLALIVDRDAIKEMITSRFSNLPNQMEGAKDAVSPTSGYSSTNTQVKGIDEGDLVKTDGKRIIHVNGQTIRILEVATSKAVGKIEYIYTDKDTKFYYPSEVFLYKDTLVVMGSISQYNGGFYPMMEKDGIARDMIWRGYQDSFVSLYDLRDPSAPKLLKNYELSGSYYSARLNDGELMVVSNQFDLMIYAKDGSTSVNAPEVRETMSNVTISSLDTKSAYVLPGKQGDSFVNILKMNLGTSSEPKLTSFLGSIQTLYVDNDNLLMAQYRYVVSNTATGEGKTLTDILRFDIDTLELKADASIDGYLLNQFSLDIHDGYVRVASTKWSNDGKVANAVHIFNMSLDVQSSIVNLAEGETIRAVRFIGDKGYVVTFENVDPLFVIDFSNPSSIKVTGELKVPGFSTYLHPVSDSVLFGIAEDLEVIPMKDTFGNTWNSVNRFGIKISLFNVNDPTKPIEIDSKRVLGQNGYTEASYNHRAVVFDADNGLLYLPFSDADYTTQICQTTDGKEGEGKYTYCAYKIESGLKVISIDENSVELVKSIVVAANNDYSNLVTRVLYVGDKLYAMTGAGVLVYDRNDFSLLTSIKY